MSCIIFFFYRFNIQFRVFFLIYIFKLKKFESQMKSNKWSLMKNKHLGYITTDPKNLGLILIKYN